MAVGYRLSAVGKEALFLTADSRLLTTIKTYMQQKRTHDASSFRS
jgi:hypothetical protein